MFNSYFVNIGNVIDNKIPRVDKNHQVNLNNIKTNKTFFLVPTIPQEIFKIIESLDQKKTLGPNSIPTFILKQFNNFFSEKLSTIINLSFETGIFPNMCKIAKVIPIFKKDDELQCENYRPISLLPNFSKIFEKVIYNRMYEFLSKNDLIYKRQFGFRRDHSSNHALISVSEDIKVCIDKGLLTAGIFIDLEKAFDTVNHSILSDKLQHYGFRGNSHKLIVSFLSNRKQFVSIQGFNSQIMDIKCGVPQGSTLGPLLFSLYLNDLRFCLKNASSNHFADDTCIIYSSINKLSKLKTFETILNTELKAVVEWLNINRLSLNVNKSKLLMFHSKRKKINYESFSIKLNNVRLKPKQNVKYLGLIIDNFLSWDDHILTLGKTLSRSNGIIAKLRHYLPKLTLISVYYAIFHSYLLYGNLSWSQTINTNVEKINVIQKKCLRLINFAQFNSHTASLFRECNILKLEDIIKMEKIKFAYQFQNNSLPIDLNRILNRNINNYNTRNMSKQGLVVPKIYTVMYGEKSLRFSIPKEWNKFIKVHDVSLISSVSSLKRILKNEYISKYI